VALLFVFSVEAEKGRKESVVAQFEFPILRWVILSLRRIWRVADIHLAAVVAVRARSFRTEVPQDDAGAVYSSN
jgi:hypothetical protein